MAHLSLAGGLHRAAHWGSKPWLQNVDLSGSQPGFGRLHGGWGAWGAWGWGGEGFLKPPSTTYSQASGFSQSREDPDSAFKKKLSR